MQRVFFQLIYQSRLLRADVSEAVREEPWLPSLNRTLDSLRNLGTRLWTGGRPGREDLVGALLRGFKINKMHFHIHTFKMYFLEKVLSQIGRSDEPVTV